MNDILATAAKATAPPMLPMAHAVATAISFRLFGSCLGETGTLVVEEIQTDHHVVMARRDEIQKAIW
jgi:hypothetical protein